MELDAIFCSTDELQHYFDALRQLTEEMYNTSGQRVVYLLHSMGGPITWYFLGHQSQSWKDKYVESVISVAGAWGGSIKAVKVYTAGKSEFVCIFTLPIEFKV